jgi:hypothetical protein
MQIALSNDTVRLLLVAVLLYVALSEQSTPLLLVAALLFWSPRAR